MRREDISFQVEGSACDKALWKEGTWNIKALTVSSWGLAEGMCHQHMWGPLDIPGGLWVERGYFTRCPGENLVVSMGNIY